MYCNSDIHDYLKESEVVCPFCDEKIIVSRGDWLGKPAHFKGQKQ